MDDPAAQDNLIGTAIGSYRVERKLGEGGMGAVYEMVHHGIGKRLALKLLHAEYAAKPQVVQRFFDEARAVNLIGHPNIVDIIDFAQLPDGRSYITMEFLDGEPLASFIRKSGALPPEKVRDIAVPICSALAAAHEQGIVHRDLKPENIHLVPRPDNPHYVKVLDFGIAKLSADLHLTPGAATRSGVVMGTPTYMSPEQAMGRTKEIDYRTDIYALGVICYEMLSGDVPFAAESFGDLMLQHLQQPPRPLRELRPEVAASWDQVVQRALAKRREDRFQSMSDFAAAIEAAARDHSQALTMAAGAYAATDPKDATVAMPPGAHSAPPTMPAAAAPARPTPAPFPGTPPAAAIPPLYAPGTTPGSAPGTHPGTVALPDRPAPRTKLPLVLGVLAGVLVGLAVLFLIARGKSSSSTTVDADAAQVARSLPPDAAAVVSATPPDAAPVVTATPPDAAPPAVVASAPADAGAAAKRPPATEKKPVRRGTGQLAVVVIPWAEVLVDGKSVGYAPKTLTLPAGRHKVTLRNPELGKNITVRVRVEPGKTQRIEKNWQ